MSSTPMSTCSTDDDFVGYDVHCGIAQTNNLLYARNYEQSRPFREHNMHRKFAYFIENHYVYAVLTGFEDNNATTVRYYTALLQMVISQNIQSRNANLNCQEQDQFYTKLLKDAFATVEEQFRHKYSEKLSEKTVLDIELNGTKAEHYPIFNERIKELACELSPGLSAVVVLIHDGRIYVANIGDTRAILCKKVLGESGQDYVRTVQLSTTHDLDNVNEIRRLNQLGVNTDLVRQKGEIGNMNLTRCLANLWLKSFYKDFVGLESATQDPILAEPDITAIALDHTCLFLILASASLIETLREATGKSDVTDELVQMIYDEYQKQTDLENIAQSVVSQICQQHHSCFASNHQRSTCRQREDITLLIRDLNVGDGGKTPVLEQFGQLTILTNENNTSQEGEHSPIHHTRLDNDQTITDRRDRVLGASVSQCNLLEDSSQSIEDEEEIEAYVDFTDLLKAYHEAPVPVAN